MKKPISKFSYIAFQIGNSVIVFLLFILSVLFIGKESQTSHQFWEIFGIEKTHMPILGSITVALLIMFIYLMHWLRKTEKVDELGLITGCVDLN